MKVLRWVLFLPGATLASVIGAFLGYLAGNLFGDTAMQASAAFFGTLGFVSVAGIIAPTHRSVVTITITSIVTLVAGAGFALSEFTTLEPYASMSASLKVLIPVAQILGGIYSVFGVQALFAVKLEYLLRKMHQLAVAVTAFGLNLAIVGLIVGLVYHSWFGLGVALGVIILGYLTRLQSRIHLMILVRRDPRLREWALRVLSKS
ncbi:MAG: hypothetical protein QOH41_2116 [Blastocatellia bacterium]|jgi:hypothetical protein|nr:hypothetical protein [Blastocatellia bacterium]